MWARDLFKAIGECDITKERELMQLVPFTTKCSLDSIKRVYNTHKKQGMTPFIAAILHNDMALCEQLIEEGIDFGQQSFAVINDQQGFIEFNNNACQLLVRGPNSNVFKDFKKTTPMFWAIKCEKLCLIDKLISRGHKMNSHVEKYSGMPTLSFAILNRNIPVVEHFLKNHTCDIHENSLPGMKPLDVAIRSGNPYMVKLLLKHGESPDCARHLLSPLLQAVFLKNIQMATLLLDMGANINFGVERGNIFPPINMAVLRSNFEIAIYLIEAGANVKVKDSTDNTALHLLLPHLKAGLFYNDINPSSHLKLAKLILDKGGQVDVANNKGIIPLVEAILWCVPELVDLFLSTPVDVNKLLNLKSKATFLHIAVSPPVMFGPRGLEDLNTKRRCSIVQSLLKKDADVNIQTEDGRTSLHYAAESGNVKLVKLLLASIKDINKPSANGKVALHFAAYSGSFSVVKLLLESGASVNVKDKVGSTPLDFGIMENAYFDSETAKLLIDYGGDMYSHCVLEALKTYDVLFIMVRFDLIKLFWREGYPFDLTILPTKNFFASMQSFFRTLGQQRNVVKIGLKKKYNETNSKQIEELMNTQGAFINGVEKNDVKLTLNALQKGAEVRGGSVKVPSPLHFLAKRGFTDVAQILLRKGVKPNSVDIAGKTPADLAVEFGHFNIYKTLLQYGACYKRTGFDTSRFQRQGNNHHHEMYLMIEEAFKYVKQGDHCILETLNMYVTLKKWDAYFVLVNCVDEEHRTLMALAMERGHIVIVQKLMEYRLQAPEITTLQLD